MHASGCPAFAALASVVPVGKHISGGHHGLRVSDVCRCMAVGGACGGVGESVE